LKLATLKSADRDGTLVVVDKALRHCVPAKAVAPGLRAAVEAWDQTAPLLADLADELEAGKRKDARPFDPAQCAAPLPRAFQFVDGSAYVHHMELVRKARGAEMPESFWTDPLMYQGLSNSFLGARDDIAVEDQSWGIDFEGEIAVIVDDVPKAVPAGDAARHIKLIALLNDVSLRGLIPGELSKGFGFVHSKPASSFSPVAVTPDELGAAWGGTRLHLPLRCQVNGRLIGAPNAGRDMTFDFAQLIAHAARTRRLTAGTIVGSGTVSNVDRTAGSACLAEVRMIETINSGAPRTDFLRFGDTVRIDMTDSAGASIFGAIEQTIVGG